MTLDADRGRIALGRQTWDFPAGEEMTDRAELPDNVLLLVSGAAALHVVTPFGPCAAACAPAPAFLNLPRALSGTVGLVRIAPSPGSRVALVPSADARRLLFLDSDDGAAFRRIAIRGTTALLRGCNETLHGFFDPPADSRPASPPAPRPPSASAVRPATEDEVAALFAAVGLDPGALPDLGLECRRLEAGERLLAAGEPGDDAWFLGSGKLRVSISIPGVGQEAIAILEPGELVGEMALVDDAPRSADVFAHGGPAVVYALSRTVFRTLLDSGSRGGARLLGRIAMSLSRRLDEALRRVAAFRQISGFG